MATTTTVSTKATGTQSNFPTTNFDGNTSHLVGDSGGSEFYLYAGFDLPVLPAGSVVTSASIRVRHSGNVNGSFTIGCRQVTSAWDETSLTWNSRPSIAGTDAAQVASGTVDADLFFPVTALVQAWYAGTANHGVVLFGVGFTDRRSSLASDDNSTVAHRPTLLLTYNEAPSAPGAFTSPTSGQVITDADLTDTVAHGGSTDPDGNPLSYDFDLSYDNGGTWTAVRTKQAGTSFVHDYTSAPNTSAAKWRSRAWDGLVYGPYTSSALFTVNHNDTPTAPTPTEPVGNATKDRNGVIRLAATFNDPDLPNDSVSQSRWRYRIVGAPSWTTVTQSNNLRFYDITAGSLTAGQYEWQAEYTDAVGAVSPWSVSEFFTAANPPAGPVITTPADGATVDQLAVVAWSSAAQDAFEVRRVADNAGSPNTATVYYASGVVESASARNHPLNYETNNRYEHVQMRVRSAGLWSAWVSVRVLVSYTAPAQPSVEIYSEPAALRVRIVNPAAAAGEPTVVSHDLWRRETLVADAGIRIATGITPGGTFTDYTPASGLDYEFRAVSTATNQITSTSPWAGAALVVSATDTYGGGY